MKSEETIFLLVATTMTSIDSRHGHRGRSASTFLSFFHIGVEEFEGRILFDFIEEVAEQREKISDARQREREKQMRMTIGEDQRKRKRKEKAKEVKSQLIERKMKKKSSAKGNVVSLGLVLANVFSLFVG